MSIVYGIYNRPFKVSEISNIVVNSSKGDEEHTTKFNKNLKLNPAQYYENVFTKTANLFNSLSQDTVNNVELISTFSSDEVKNAFEVVDINGDIINDEHPLNLGFSARAGLTDVYQTDFYIRFSSLDYLPPILFYRFTKDGGVSSNYTFVRLDSETINGVDWYKLRVLKLTNSDDALILMKFYVYFERNNLQFNLPIIPTINREITRDVKAYYEDNFDDMERDI